MRPARGPHRLLTRKLAPAIGIERRGRRLRLPGAGTLAREDVIGRDLHEGKAPGGTGTGHGTGRGAIDLRRQGLLLFGPVHRREGGCVDDGTGLQGCDPVGAGFWVGQVRRLPAQALNIGQGGQLLGHLAPLAKDQDHDPTPSLLPTPSRPCSGRHQASLSRYHCTVRASPSSSVTEGRQPSSSRMRVASIA